MSGILEALDMMYEVKGDIESSHNKRMALEKDASKRKIGLKNIIEQIIFMIRIGKHAMVPML